MKEDLVQLLHITHFLRVILTGLLLLAGPQLIMAIGEPDPLLPVDTPFQIISENTSTSRTFIWQSSANSSGSLQYRRQGNPDEIYVETGAATVYPYRDEDTEQEIYSAHLTNLQPDTTYEYRLVEDDKTTNWKEFKTTLPDLNHYKVLIFGDSQSTDYSTWGRTARTAYNLNPDAEFFINMGDLVDNGQDHKQWRAWFHYGRPLLKDMPLVPILGNHEAYSLGWAEAQPQAYQAIFPVPTNGPVGQDHLVYSFTYGDVHFAALNTDYSELNADYPNMMEDEQNWLDADLSQASKAGKRLIVLMHRPPWISSSSTTVSLEGRSFMPIFDKYKVNLVLDAHIHTYSRTNPLTSSGDDPNGTVYVTTGRSGDDIVYDRKGKQFDASFYDPTDLPMYLTLDVRPDEFHIEACKIDGTLIDSATIPTKKTIKINVTPSHKQK